MFRMRQIFLGPSLALHSLTIIQIRVVVVVTCVVVVVVIRVVLVVTGCVFLVAFWRCL